MLSRRCATAVVGANWWDSGRLEHLVRLLREKRKTKIPETVSFRIKLLSYLDETDNVPVHFLKILRRDPPFCVKRPSDLLDSVPHHEFSPHLESSYIARATCLYVPVPRDLNGIFLVRDWVENRLIWQARRPSFEPGCSNKFKFPWSSGAK